jgi:hypothetical protein
VRSAVSGIGSTVDLVVEVHDGARPLRVAIPDVPDLMPETVALVVDTAVAVRRRFRGAVPPVSAIRFDHAHHGLKVAQYAAMADVAGAMVHVNASYVSAEGFVGMRRPESESGSRTPVVGPRPPFTVVDGVVAHELWHHMESAFEVRRYADSIEMRRELGRYFGVETLEHAILGAALGSPQAWRDAHLRLTTEVSEYAGTATREATAELFELWWCATSPPTGVVACFGDLVERFLLA